MIFEYFGYLGTSPGGLGHHFEPKARIFVILMTFPGEWGMKKYSDFEVKIDMLWIHFLVFF